MTSMSTAVCYTYDVGKHRGSCEYSLHTKFSTVVLHLVLPNTAVVEVPGTAVGTKFSSSSTAVVLLGVPYRYLLVGT